MNRDRSRTGRDGFSLIEVLVALVVIGSIATATAALTGTFRRLEQRAVAQMPSRENIMTAGRTFRLVVSNALPRAGAEHAASVASSRQLDLLSTGLPVMMLNQPQPLHLRVRTNGETSDLLLGWQEPLTGKPQEEVLLEGATAIELAYFGAVDEAPPRWQGEWSRADILPRAILLRVRMPGLGGPIDIIARTAYSKQHECLMQPASPACVEG